MAKLILNYKARKYSAKYLSLLMFKTHSAMMNRSARRREIETHLGDRAGLLPRLMEIHAKDPFTAKTD